MRGVPLAEPPVPAAPPQKRFSSVVAVVVIAVIVVTAVIAFSLLRAPVPSPQNVAPHIVANLANGTAVLEIPFWAWYSAPDLRLRGFATSMNVSYSSTHLGAATSIPFQWGNISGTSESVRFVLERATNLSSLGELVRPSSGNGFEYLPAGECDATCGKRGIVVGFSGPTPFQSVDFSRVRMNYTVYRIAEVRNSVEQRWLQVNYTFEALAKYLGVSLPAANVTLPGPSDLVPATSVQTITFPRTSSWALNFSARELQPTGTSFGNALPPLTFAAGSAGAFNATLGSSFRWDSTSDSWIGFGAGVGTTLSYQVFFDIRFGTLVVQYF